MTRFIPALTLLFAVLALSADAGDIYVNNTAGDDRNNGQLEQSVVGQEGPLRTITQALKIARRGDRLILAKTDESYRESITLFGNKNSGSLLYPFVIAGNGATLDGSVLVADEAWENFRGDVFRFRLQRTGFAMLYRNDRPLTRKQTTGDLNKPLGLAPLEWALIQDWIYFRVESNTTPQSYQLTHAGEDVGITLYRVHNVQIFDLTVQGFRLDGINAHDLVTGARVEGVTCRGNGRSGVSVGGSSRLQLNSSLVGNNGHAQIRLEGHSQLRVESCDLIDNTAPNFRFDGGRLFIDGKAVDLSPR